MNQTQADKPSRRPINPAFVLLLGIGVLVGVQLFRGRSADRPPMFDQDLRLDEAMAQASADGRVVFAVATADWCGPCQTFKRGGLRDEAVERWVGDRAVPVYIDVDQRPREAEALGVRRIPTAFLIGPEGVIATSGGQSGPELLDWLRANAPPAGAARADAASE